MVERVDSRRLLLIDDSEIALAYAESVLTDVGFDVRAVSSLQAFETVLASFKPHLIVTDLYMPEMSGAELCQWLRRQVGADAYLSKLAGLDALPDRLNTLCDEILW